MQFSTIISFIKEKKGIITYLATCESNCSLNLTPGCVNCSQAFMITANEPFTVVWKKKPHGGFSSMDGHV